MKQIIKNGIYNIVTCGKCKCEFAFDPVVDLESNGKVLCPQCGTECTPTTKS